MWVNALDIHEFVENEKNGMLKAEEICSTVDNITKSIQNYTQVADAAMLKMLKMLCVQKSMPEETAKMTRNIGMHYFYRNDTERALRYMNEAVKAAKDLKSNNLSVQFFTDKGLVDFYDLNYKASERVFKQAFELLPNTNELEYKMLYLLYLRTGILYWHMGDYTDSYTMLCEALEYAKEIPEQGKVLLNIGANFEKRRLYDEALEYFNKAIELYGEDFPVERSCVHNSIAELYKNIGDYKRALNHINEAFALLGSKNLSKFFILFMTYTEVKILQGESEEELNRLIELLSQVNEIFMYKCFIIDGINIAVKADSRDKQLMDRHADEITKIVDKVGERNKSYKEELDSVLSDMCFTLKVLSSN